MPAVLRGSNPGIVQENIRLFMQMGLSQADATRAALQSGVGGRGPGVPLRTGPPLPGENWIGAGKTGGPYEADPGKVPTDGGMPDMSGGGYTGGGSLTTGQGPKLPSMQGPSIGVDGPLMKTSESPGGQIPWDIPTGGPNDGVPAAKTDGGTGPAGTGGDLSASSLQMNIGGATPGAADPNKGKPVVDMGPGLAGNPGLGIGSAIAGAADPNKTKIALPGSQSSMSPELEQLLMRRAMEGLQG